MMKKWIWMSTLSLLMTACAASQLTDAERVEARRALAQRVTEAIENKRFKADIDYIYPHRGGSRHLDYGYSLTVHGDSLISYLPYFGRAYHVPYGGGKGLNFTALLSDYRATRTKKDATRVEWRVRNEEDTYYYIVDVFDNGRISVEVAPQNRDPVSFSGELTFDETH